MTTQFAIDTAQSEGHNIVDFWDINGWAIIAIIEGLLLLLIFLFQKRHRKEYRYIELKNKAKQEEVDFSNIVNSAFYSDELYNELKIKCHPDKFPNDVRANSIANEIFQEISKNKNSYHKLQILKKRAIRELGLTFK